MFGWIVFSLSQKRAIQGPKNRRPARNPLKTLAAREDLKSEYTEIKTGVADRELKRLKLESSEYLSTSSYCNEFYLFFQNLQLLVQVILLWKR